MLRSLTTAITVLVLAASPLLCRADETTKIDLPHVDPITVCYRAFDPAHIAVNESRLMSSIASSLSAATKFRMRTGEPDTSSSVYDTGSITKFDPQGHLLHIEYLAITRFLSGGATGTRMSIPVSYTLSRTDSEVRLTFSFPDQGTSVRHGMPLLTRKLWSMDEILADYADLAARLSNINLQLNYRAAGELESRYRPEAVLGNLERMLGRPDSRAFPQVQIGDSGGVTREADYLYTDHGVRQRVHISTVPYHDGTKVAYAATLPYTLKPDGTITGDDSDAALRDLLSKVVND